MKLNRLLWTLAVGIVVPAIISIGVAYLIFGDLAEAIKIMYSLRGKPNITKDAMASLFLVISTLLGIYSLISTIFFSYLVWKVSVSTLQVTERSEKLEIERDQSIIQENALIVYYDIQRQITNLIDLYKSLIISKQEPSPSRLYLSSDWIKNIACLRNELLDQEMRYLFQFYEDFLTLQSILEMHKEPMEVADFVKILSKKYLVEGVPLPLIVQYKNWLSAESAMSLKLLVISRKIHKATFPLNRIKERSNEIKQTNNVLKWISIDVNEKKYCDIKPIDSTLFDAAGNKILEGTYNSQTGFIRGNRMYKSDGVEYNIVFDKAGLNEDYPAISKVFIYDNKDTKKIYSAQLKSNIPYNGLAIIYNNNGEKVYEGNLVNGERNGEGISYSNGNIFFSGVWENGTKRKGELKDGNLFFKGEFKDNKLWNGDVQNFTKDSYYIFTGILKNGLPYSGSGYVFRRDHNGFSYQDKQEYNSMDPEFEEEMLNQSYEDEHAQRNNEIRESGEWWDEYIKAEWTEGRVTEQELKESNIIMMTYK